MTNISLSLFKLSGFSNEVSVDVNDSAKSKTAASQNGNASPDSLSNGDAKSGIFSNTDHVLESESAYTHSEDELARSPQDSPAGRTALDGASPGFSDVFAKSTEADAETHRYGTLVSLVLSLVYFLTFSTELLLQIIILRS